MEVLIKEQNVISKTPKEIQKIRISGMEGNNVDKGATGRVALKQETPGRVRGT